MAKSDPEKLPVVMNELWSGMIKVSELLAPFLPATAEKLREIFAEKDKISERPAILFEKKYQYIEKKF
jgi:methionyl-tRNA synthetase